MYQFKKHARLVIVLESCGYTESHAGIHSHSHCLVVKSGLVRFTPESVIDRAFVTLSVRVKGQQVVLCRVFLKEIGGYPLLQKYIVCGAPSLVIHNFNYDLQDGSNLSFGLLPPKTPDISQNSLLLKIPLLPFILNFL